MSGVDSVAGVERVTEHGLVTVRPGFIRSSCRVRFLVLDSGGFRFLSGRGAPSVGEVLRSYVRCGFRGSDRLVQLDFPPLPTLGAEERLGRLRRSVEAYRLMRSVLGDRVLPVLHGWSRDELVMMSAELGGVREGCVASYFVTSVLHGVRRADIVRRLREALRIAPFTWTLVLGGGGPNAMHLAFYLGADAIDGTAWRTAAARKEVIVPGAGIKALGRSKRPKLGWRDVSIMREYWVRCGNYVNPLQHLSIDEFLRIAARRFDVLALWNAYAMKCEEYTANEFRNDPDRYCRYLTRRWRGTEWGRYLRIVKSDYVQTRLTLYLRLDRARRK